MTTANKNNGAVETNGAGDGNGMSTEALAAVLGKQRQEGSNQSQATAGTAAGANNEGQATETGTATEDLNLTAEEQAAAEAEAQRLAALSPEERQAEEAAAETARREALTPEERAAEDAAAAAQAAADDEEPLDVSQVKLNPEQKQHVGELFKTRIGKVIKKLKGEAETAVETERQAREAAETEVQTLRQQLDEAAQAAPAPVGNEPLGHVTTQAQLDKAVRDAQSVRQWAKQNLIRMRRNPDAVREAVTAMGATLPDESPEALEEFLSEAELRAEETLGNAPSRQQWLQQEQQFNVNAEKDFPFLRNPKDPMYVDAMGALRKFPEIKREPHWKAIIGVYAEGLKVVKARQAAAKANGNGAATTATTTKAPPPKPTKVNTRPAGAGARPAATGEVKAKAAEQKFESTGTVDALANMFASKRQ